MKFNRFFPCLISLVLLSGCSAVGSHELSEPPKQTIPTESETTAQEQTEETSSALSSANTDPPESVSITIAESVEVYDSLTISSLITDSNVILQNGDEIVDTSELGEAEVTVRYIYEGVLYEQSLNYTVEDNTAPLVLNAGGGAMVEQGKSFDLDNYIGYADNFDRTPVLTYTGVVDTSVCGTYPLKATVTDSSGNSTSWDLKITVLSEIPVPEDNAPPFNFDSYKRKYAADNVKFGIDVSKWQGKIDFDAVKAAGCEFVIMRMGHFYDELTLDEYYKTNMASAKAAGLDVGVYIYTTANSEEEIKQNAKWIADNLDGQELDFPVVFDWEDFSNFQQYNMSINDLNNYFELFADEMESYGYSAMLYSSKNFLNNFWYDHPDHPVWLAHYTDETDYTGRYDMWQSSCHGVIDGINGFVDMNILYSK